MLAGLEVEGMVAELVAVVEAEAVVLAVAAEIAEAVGQPESGL